MRHVRSTVLAVLAGGLLVAVPTGADAAPVPGTVTTVRTTCSAGGGTVQLRQQDLEGGATHVGVSARDVRNGRWSGSYAHSIVGSEDETDRRVHATAADHAFSTSFDVEGDTRSAGVSMHPRRGGRQCVAAFADRAKRTVVTNARLVLVVSYPEPGHVTERVLIEGCREGSEWRVSSRYRFDDTVLGSGSGGFVCHDGIVRVPKSQLGTDSDLDRPSGFSAVVHGSTGDVRRVAYSAR